MSSKGRKQNLVRPYKIQDFTFWGGTIIVNVSELIKHTSDLSV